MLLLVYLPILSSSAKATHILFSTYVRSPKTPLESYPFSHLDLCISHGISGVSPELPRQCKSAVMEVPSRNPVPPTPWCKSRINKSVSTFLQFLIAKHYHLIFVSGEMPASCSLGPTNNSIYTHFNFEYLKTLDEFSLNKILPSNPVNLSQSQTLSFTYETSFVAFPRVRQSQPVLFSYMIGVMVVLVGFWIAIFYPKFVTKPCYVLVSRVPTHAFPLAIVCGSGAGTLAAHCTLVALFSTGVPVQTKLWPHWIVPEITSALATAFVTSWLCRIWRVKDVASALYFAPLVFPGVICVAVFSVQWISVGIDACTKLPLEYFLQAIVVIALVKIPVNLVGCLVCAAVFPRPDPALSEKVRVIVRRFTGSRTNFLVAANSALFLVAFPWVQQFMESLEAVQTNIDPAPAIMVWVAWIMGSIVVGVNVLSVRFRCEADWAIFSFAAGAGGATVLWIVHNLWSVVVEGRSSTLQQTLHPTITGLVCAGFALCSGTISVLASAAWIAVRGKPPRPR
jgi:hypothetical protein